MAGGAYLKHDHAIEKCVLRTHSPRFTPCTARCVGGVCPPVWLVCHTVIGSATAGERGVWVAHVARIRRAAVGSLRLAALWTRAQSAPGASAVLRVRKLLQPADARREPLGLGRGLGLGSLALGSRSRAAPTSCERAARQVPARRDPGTD